MELETDNRLYLRCKCGWIYFAIKPDKSSPGRRTYQICGQDSSMFDVISPGDSRVPPLANINGIEWLEKTLNAASGSGTPGDLT